ncbi:Tetratricopeptide-like helical [Corchorus olitorius]|uniref:Tetratricopeptide-like helical n=1 Tax=Corchorus olitorius TaxID=93759 RepID=A0A1R3KAM3_9ROSI|nr:Tetratricopeptide-like helical [Corchorus olitorius]
MDEPSETQTQTQTTDPLTNQFGSLNDLAHELASLQDLATRGSWRSILDKVSRARALNLLSKPHDQLIYLSYNVLALSKLRRFTEASTELDSLHDFNSHHYQYESYPELYPNRSGSMVPFSLRFIHAQLPIKLGNRQEGLDRFYLLLNFIRQRIEDKGSHNLEESVKDYVSAVREYEECIERDHSDVVAVNNKALCLMYLRDLSDSIKVLENALERVPTVALNETLVINLCSMYELAYVNHSEIKRTLSNWIARVAPDDFDASCTRV